MVFVPVTSSVKSAYELFILYEIIPTVIRNNRQIIDNFIVLNSFMFLFNRL